jgi:peptidoglycan/LPS O-acetylase OafA/YrhL
MFSIERLQTKYHGAALFLAFWVRRIFRIYPLSILIVLVVFLGRLPVEHLPPGGFASDRIWTGAVVANLLLMQNLTQAPSMPAPLWSLPYEMQMYVLLPFLYLLVRRMKSVRFAVLLWILSIPLAYIEPRLSPWFSLLKAFPYFLPGLIAYRLWGRPRSPWRSFAWPVVLVALAIVASLWYRDEVGWLACLLIGLIVPRFAALQSSWLRRASHEIAKYSYSIYLVHVICLWLAFSRLQALGPAVGWLVFLLTVVLLPIALFHAIEAPMIRAGSWVVQQLFSPAQFPTRLAGALTFRRAAQEMGEETCGS